MSRMYSCVIKWTGPGARGERLGPRPLKARAADWKRRARTFRNCFFFNFLRFRFQLFWRPSLCRPRCRVPLPQSFFVFDRIVFLYKIDFQLVGSYRLLPGFTASYSIWLRFTGFYLALPSFTEFSRDFTGFTLNCSVYLRFNFSFLDTYYKV